MNIQTPQTSDIISFMEKVFAENDTDTDHVTCVPAPCGSGKSTILIPHLIAEAINSKERLIIITDSIERMQSYPTASDGLTDYILRNKTKLLILTNKNVRERYADIFTTDIVIMSTQRWADLDEKTIKRIATGRKRVIFDEKPIVFTVKNIDLRLLYAIDADLDQALNNTTSEFDKAFILKCWRGFTEKMRAILEYLEDKNQTGQSYTEPFITQGFTLWTDDCHFFHLLKTYKTLIDSFNKETVKSILLCYKLIKQGGSFCSIKIRSDRQEATVDGNYKSYFSVVEDHTHTLQEIGAKVYVLDATADINPIFDLPFFNKIDCEKLQKHLPLKINIVNVKTTKSFLTNNAKKEKRLALFPEYLNTLADKPRSIFTYKKTENFFESAFLTRPEYDFTTAHFGDLRGRNDFRDDFHVAQIGLNRFPSLFYEDIATEMAKKYHIKSDATDIRDRFLLDDLEQNIFRSALRNPNTSRDVTYTIFMDTSLNRAVIDLLHHRFDRLGAVITEIETPRIFSAFKFSERCVKTGALTIPQKIKLWIDRQPIGTTWKNNAMFAETGVSYKQFDKAKRSNKAFDRYIKSYQIDISKPKLGYRK